MNSSPHSSSLPQLKRAAVHGDIPVVRRLLSLYPSLATAKDDLGWSALHFAAQQGQTAVVKELLHHTADTQVTTPDRATPLILAASRGHTATVEYLLSQSAYVNWQDIHGKTALTSACNHGHVSCVKSLLKATADMYLPAKDGFFPIHVAAQFNRPVVVQALLDYGCNKDLVSRNYFIVMSHTILYQYINVQLFKAIRGRQAGVTPLMMAAMCRSNEAVDVLLQAEADPNTVDSAGYTALVYALQSKDMTTIDKLCCLTTVGREMAFAKIGQTRVQMSRHLLAFITDSLGHTGRHFMEIGN